MTRSSPDTASRLADPIPLPRRGSAISGHDHALLASLFAPAFRRAPRLSWLGRDWRSVLVRDAIGCTVNLAPEHARGQLLPIPPIESSDAPLVFVELVDDGTEPLRPRAWKSVRATGLVAKLGEKVLTLTGHWDDRACDFAQLDMGNGLFSVRWDRAHGNGVMLDSMANGIEVVSLADARAAVSAFARQLKKHPYRFDIKCPWYFPSMMRARNSDLDWGT